jgi:hypothetical protein
MKMLLIKPNKLKKEYQIFAIIQFKSKLKFFIINEI